MKALIEKLVSVPSPSGYESGIRDVIKETIKPFVDQVEVDALGNLIARKGKQAANGKRIMLAAHMDEIGVMVTHVDEQGYARFTNLGAVFPRNTAGGRVRFLNGASGVIGMEPHTSAYSVPALAKMFIDLGVDSAKDCPVQIGDVAVFERKFEETNNRLVAKAIDNRAGVAVLIETLRQLKNGPNEIVAVFTVQEEVGARGAQTAAYGVDPDLGIVIDVTVAADTPKNTLTQVKLGGGPAVHIKDIGSIATPEVSAWITKNAKQAKIPTQVSILTGGYTDARSIQPSRGGVPTGGISIPCRYVHTPSEMVDLDDLHASVKLLTAMLSKTVIL
ncbi:MAG: M42 family metallopeptidase [Chloroflexota bacterium]